MYGQGSDHKAGASDFLGCYLGCMGFGFIFAIVILFIVILKIN